MERADRAGWLELWREASAFRALLDDLRKGRGEAVVTGAPGGMLAFFVAALRHALGRPVLVVTPGFREALELAEDLGAWLGEEEALYFPPLEVVPYHVVARSHDLAGPRLRALARLAGGGEAVAVAPAAALLRALAPREAFARLLLSVRRGQELGVERLAATLAAAGYELADRAEMPGQAARRGGIVDVYPPGQAEPLRLEFWGDRVESLRRFDPVSQRSLELVEEAVIWPAREAVLPPDTAGGGDGGSRDTLEEVRAAVRREAASAAARLAAAGRRQDARELQARVEEQLASWGPAVAELYLPFVYERPADGGAAGGGLALLTDYFPVPPLVVEVDPVRVEEALRGAERDWRQRAAALLEAGRLLPGQVRLEFTADEVVGRWRNCQRVRVAPLGGAAPGGEVGALHDLGGKSVTGFRGQWPLFLAEARGWLAQGFRCVVAVGSEERRRRVEACLREEEVPLAPALPPPGRAAVVSGLWRRGFVAPYLRLAFVTEEELFGQRVAARPRARRAAPAAEPLAALADLRAGDYVVHLHHGVGQFLGIQTMEVQGVQRDYLLIRYAGTDRLYVPVEHINLIQKFAGGEGVEPRLNRLGGQQWERVKKRVRAALRELAADLLRLEEARRSLPGHAFGPDTVWQKEFEEAFPYEETPDQVRAIEEIKRDMESPRPMDRLLCGDVGFGKTEVAMRAAFKAVMDGKQVAVLVPTTVLAQQHYLTFKQRFAGFPVRVAMLTRFQAEREQEEVITGLRRGDVDVVIGTHRLLGGDVGFRDLGLLIVDEEHRFGVAHKEALKRLRATVDVLTMTATPIPRTLHMALAGLRDMSVIQTPPENRFPVETYVVEYDSHLVGEAIRRELARGGQVFYVHNRIGTIGKSLERIRSAVPEARVAVAHGRLPDEELEAVMLGFLQGEHDVLLCTSIIESGLDIPNANTLIVEESDRFGLAQLYQLRGRVGRSNRVAYAYFTYWRGKVLTEAAQKRLEAIKEFTELGSGFRIALRDLEIRGAGNVLGPEQHGHIAAVGFDLYHQMLEEALREARGERRAPETEPTVELACDAYLPSAYVRDARSKMEVYRRLGAARSLEDVAEVEAALRDRFGPPPPEAANLLALARVRVRAAGLGALAVVQQHGILQVTFAGYLQDLARGLEALRRLYGGRLQVLRSPRPTLRLRLGPERPLGVRAEADGGVSCGSALDEAERLLVAVAELPEFAAWAAGTAGVPALNNRGSGAQTSR